MFFNRKHRLTKLCERVTLRMIENAAMDDASLLRAEFDKGTKRMVASDSDKKWSAWMRDEVEHPKRTAIIYLIIYLAAAKFWKDINKIEDEPNWGISTNPFKKTNSDVIIAEALIFFWYNFFLFVRAAVKEKELTQADNQAVADAGTTICHVIQENTHWPVAEILEARTNEYENRDTSRNPIEAFCGVVLGSIGKQSINDPPDRSNSLDFALTPVTALTMIHMTAQLPAYIEIYKNIVEHYPMD